MIKKFQIFTVEHYGHNGLGAPNGHGAEILPLWKDAYQGIGYTFNTLDEAEVFLNDFDPHRVKVYWDYIILPIYLKNDND
jgi:hypothetical protein